MLLPRFLPDPWLAERGYASYAYLLDGLYALKGGLKAAGSAIDWLASLLSPAGEAPNYAVLEAEARESVGRRAGPLWLPHLIGSGTPQGDRFSRAAAAGLLIEHRPADLFRGMLESLAFWTRQNLEEMAARTGAPVEALTLTGGTTRLRLLSSLKADVLNLPVRVPGVPEAAATGAALLAGLGSGVFRDPLAAVESLRYDCEVIAPDARRAAWYDTMYHSAYLPLYEALQPVHKALKAMDTQSQGGDTK
jgi:xylulokinase